MKKVRVLIKVAIAFLFAFFLSFNLVVDRAMATGEFTKTCEDIEINGSTLSASCDTASGNDQDTSINLDQYIGNLDGTLSWQDQDFSKTCQDIALAQLLGSKQLILTARCQAATGGDNYYQTDIVLNDHIANINGTLEYE